MIGESPTRPAIFHASPLVVVTPDISPLAFRPRQLMVPVGGRVMTSRIQASVSSLCSGNMLRRSAVALVHASTSVVQLLCPALSRSDFFHATQAFRESST